MALVTQNSIAAALIKNNISRQTSIAQARLKFEPKQIQKILVEYADKNLTVNYNELLKLLKYPLTDQNFQCVIEDSLICVVLLGRNCIAFVKTVCALDWINRNEELVELFSRFLVNLVSAHTYHCHLVLKHLIKLFHVKDEHWEDAPSPELVRKWSCIHSIIAQIVAIMPMTSDLLLQVVIENFPYYKSGSFVNRAFVHNLIWISKYLPSLRENIMTIIINKMIVMDVNIVERDKNKQADTQFEMEVDDPDEIQDSLDYCMLEVLNWLEDEREPILSILCNVFEKVVLPTYGIRHVQFLVVYTISISQQCMDRVLNNLWCWAAGLRAAGPALATRRTAATHLAGLLARCVRIPHSRLAQHLRCMCEWSHAYLRAALEACTTHADNVKSHANFHAVCHAVFYLIAFKHQRLFATKDNLNFIESLNLPRLVNSPLNPLRWCPAQVTRAFSMVTRAHQVAYCQPVIDNNRRHSLIDNENEGVDDWFPYDPYTLPRSGKKIWPLCIEYKDFSRDGDDETQYSGMKRKLEEDDDFLVTSVPALPSFTSHSPGFRTSESIASLH